MGTQIYCIQISLAEYTQRILPFIGNLGNNSSGLYDKVWGHSLAEYTQWDSYHS